VPKELIHLRELEYSGCENFDIKFTIPDTLINLKKITFRKGNYDVNNIPSNIPLEEFWCDHFIGKIPISFLRKLKKFNGIEFDWNK
jgi:hypothetical protein